MNFSAGLVNRGRCFPSGCVVYRTLLLLYHVAVKIASRPTVTELSRGQNHVRVVAESKAMSCNSTPTWCKMPGDNAVNVMGIVLFGSGAFCFGRAVYDLANDCNKIEGR
jgi:hypothetical protein